MGKEWGWFWFSEPLESFDVHASWVFPIAFFALLQDSDKSFQHLTDVRASLSTWWNSCEGLVSVGGGLPTQRNNWGPHFWLLFVVQDIFSELHSFSWSHQSEEGLHPSYLHFGQFPVNHMRTVSGIVSFLFTRVACLSYVHSVLSAQRVSCFCGVQSTSHCVGHQWALVHALAQPCHKCDSSSCHVVVRILFMHLVASAKCHLT